MADGLNLGQVFARMLASNEDWTSDTTYRNIPGFQFNAPGNTLWLLEAWLYLSKPSAAQASKLGIATSGAPQVRFSADEQGANFDVVDAPIGTDEYVTTTNSGTRIVRVHGRISNVSGVRNFAMQFAQNVSEANTHTVLAGSWMKATLIG